MAPPLISDITPEVAYMLGNRTDLTIGDPSKVDIWVRDAYLELAMNYPFDELEDSVNDNFVQGVDTYEIPTEGRGIKALTLVFPAGGREPRPIRRRHIRNIRRYQTTNQGPPAIYAPLTPAGQPRSIIVRPVPDQSYSIIWDVWTLPTIQSDVEQTQIMMPADWLEVLRYAACIRGHVELQEQDKAQDKRTFLYGGQDAQTGRQVPGIIKQRMLSRMADQDDVEYNIVPRVRRYTSVS
jgi:hypothetical protein